jgi:predicted MPP superfamily phosphohydrolase
MESMLHILYAGRWPALLWQLWPGSDDVHLVRHRMVAPRGTAPCRIAFASDLHIGPTTPDSVLKRAAALIRDAAPHVLLLGGDYLFLDATPAKLDRLAAWITDIRAPMTVAVVGNHDLWGEEAPIVNTLRRAGARVLVNESVRLPPPHESIAIVGLDDPMTGVVDAEKAFADSSDAAVRIVLCHEPDGLLACGERDFDLFLCGHTHGGQVATPQGPILVPPGELHRKYCSGFHLHHDRQLFVSRGIGGAEIPMRFFAPPDVLIVDVTGAGN